MTRKKDKRLKDETGNRYGRLVVLEYAGTRPNHRGGAVWKCRCDCGNETVVWSGSLRGGDTRSCGCLSRELSSKRSSTRDGLSCTAEYRAWRGMINRCHGSEKAKWYKNYGDRGIVVCDRWRYSFDAFLEDVGKRPSVKHSIDRVDNNGPYSPDNFRWATYVEQQNNKRNNHIVTYLGLDMTVAQLERLLGFREQSLSRRLSYYQGDIERAINAETRRISRLGI